jgi:Dolichyl-phosphate-mannose-protein mannosyltransferase
MTQVRRRIDAGWTLAAIYAAYVVVSLPMQQKVWATLASGDAGLGILSKPALALFVVTFGAVALAAYLAPATSEELSARLSEWLRRRVGLALPLLLTTAIVAPVAVAYAVLDCFPNSGDEFAYFFQAGLFAKGQLWAEAPPLGYTFVPFRTWIIGDKWLSQYPPGWPLAMAAALLTGIPAWSLNALMGVASAAGLMSPLWRFPDRAGALAVAGFYVLTPFYVLNAASFHSHMLSALLILALCLCCLWYERDRRLAALGASGALLGLIGLTRYFSLVLLLPALCYWLLVENRRSRFRIVAVMALAALPFGGLLMAYHYLVTGSPLRTTYALIPFKETFISFSPRDVLEGAKLTIDRIEDLGIWASPVLIPVYLVCIASKLRSRSIAFYDLIFPAFVAGYVLFPGLGGNRYGPRYYFDAFPLMLATIMSAAPHAAAWARRFCNRPIAIHAALVGAVYLLTGLPFALAAYHRQVESRQEPFRFAMARGLADAIVVIKNSSGRGLLAEDLARNDPGLEAPVLYARAAARPEIAAQQLRLVFPDRSIWIYERDDPEQVGRLEPFLP